MRLSLALSLIVSCLLTSIAAANQQIAPVIPFREGVKNFVFFLNYSGDQDKPFYSLMLTVQPTPSSAVSMFDNYTPISEQEAGKLIDALATIGFFQESADTTTQKAAEQTGYTLTIEAGEGAKHVRRTEPLGFDLRTLSQMDEMRKAMSPDAAKLMDVLLGRLSGLRKAWTEEGRVFARRGLVTLIKNPAPIPVAQAVVFDVTMRNESLAPMTLPHDPAEVDRWNIHVHGPDQVDYNVVRPGRPAIPPAGKVIALDPGKSITFKLSLAGCKYFIVPKTFPAKMVGLETLPKGKYTFNLSTDFGEAVARANENLSPDHPAWIGEMIAAPLTIEIAGLQ